LSYTPAKGDETLEKVRAHVKFWFGRFLMSQKGDMKIRAADAKEVGVGNPAEETYCYPNTQCYKLVTLCQYSSDFTPCFPA